MAHQFTVYTTRGEIDSLTRPVKILFTLMPAHSNGTCNMLEFESLSFGTNTGERKNIEWKPFFAFSMFNFGTTKRGRTSFTLGRHEAYLSPGQCVKMTSPPSGNPVHWSNPEYYKNGSKFEMTPIRVFNDTGSTQSIALHAGSPTQSDYWTMAAYFLASGETLTTESRVVLQAYAVDPSFDVYNVLRPEDLSEPLFATPLRGETLPSVSHWRLSQTQNGKFQLRNDDNPELGVHSTATLAKSIEDIKIQLGAMQISLGNLQHRLDDMEEQQPTLAPGQPLGSDPRISSLEEKAAKWDEFLAQNQEGLSRVQKFIQKLRPELAVMGRTISTVEATTGNLAAVIDRTRGDLAAVQTSLVTTGDQMTGLDGRVRTVEGKTERLTEALNEIRNALPGAWPSSPTLEDSPIMFPSQLPPEVPRRRA